MPNAKSLTSSAKKVGRQAMKAGEQAMNAINIAQGIKNFQEAKTGGQKIMSILSLLKG